MVTRFRSFLSDFGIRILSAVLSGTLNLSFLPVLTEIALRLKERIGDKEDEDEIRRDLEFMLDNNDIDFEILAKIIKEVLSNKNAYNAIRNYFGGDPSLFIYGIEQTSFFLSGYSLSEFKEFNNMAKTILDELRRIRDLTTYYFVPADMAQVRKYFRLPDYIDNVVYMSPEIIDIDAIIERVLNGDNIAIVGKAGVGKTVALYETLKRAFFDYGLNVALLPYDTDVRTEHEDMGFILFLDDLYKNIKVAESIAKTGARYIVATVRAEDWDYLPSEVKDAFVPMEIKPLNRDELWNILTSYSGSFGIEVEPEAIDIILDRCAGTPIYIRYVFEDADRSNIRKITKTMASEAPQLMYDYVAKIIGDILYKNNELINGAYGVALTLRILGDLNYYEINEMILDAIFGYAAELTAKKFNETVNYDLYLKAKAYLERDPIKLSVSYPHDIWYDVIVRRKTRHKVAGLFSLVSNKISQQTRRKIIKAAFEKVIKNLLKEDPRASIVDKISISYYYLLNKDILEGLDVPKEFIGLPKKYVGLPISRIFLSLTTVSPPPHPPPPPPPPPKEAEEPPTDKAGIKGIYVAIGGRVYLVPGTFVEIGRHPVTGNIMLEYKVAPKKRKRYYTKLVDKSVSRKHLRVVIMNGRIAVMDLGSTNGTYVDGNRLEPRKYYFADRVVLGRGLEIRFKVAR